MKNMFSKRLMHRVVLGSVLFGLFFGAGNLIFPINIGQLAGSNINTASIAFGLSAVVMPVLAVFFVAMSKSSSLEQLLSPFGKKYARFFNILLLLTIGPLFALPRTATVPYEVGVRLLLPSINHDLGLFLYSVLFFILAMFLSLKPNKVKDIVGKFINPIFLTCLFIFFVIFFLNTMGPIDNIVADPTYRNDLAFTTSFIYGYQTMDLLAALVFTYVIIIVNDYSDDKNSKENLIDLLFAGIFAGVLLLVIYYVLNIIGVSSRNIFEVAPNGGIALGQIFNHYLGSAGTLFFSITITLACLKTAIGLIIACSNYFSSLFPNISYKKFVVIFACFALFVSNIGLNAIVLFAIPVLNFIYPLAIMHVMYGLFIKHENIILNKSVLFVTMIAAVIEVIITFPSLVNSNSIISGIVGAYKQLPLANFGIAWVNFSIVGLLIGFIITKYRKTNNIQL